MSAALTPYDTGERLEPIPWPHPVAEVLARVEEGGPRERLLDRFGRVDFDNDEGATVATVYVAADELNPGAYVLHVIPHQPLAIRAHAEEGDPAPWR